ncbi:MAG: HAD-IC family P-type ATPase [bacterium]|nr:HAD-IC family P-type ATPase [bacterium]
MLDYEWHDLEIDQIFNVLETSQNGLTSKSASENLKKHGANEISKAQPKTNTQILLEQFANPLIYILIIVALITLVIGHYVDTLVILFIVISNGLIGYFQEIKASKSLTKLDTFLITNCKVLRDKELTEIPATNLALGDIVIIEPGAKIPADLRIIESVDLRIDESILTGESIPPTKNTKTLPKDTVISDRRNIAYSGTFVVSGRGRGVVVAIGENTEFGKIAKSIQLADPPESPLEKELKDLSKQLIYVILATMVVLLIIGFWRKLDAVDMFLTAINLAVSAIPEGLPAVMTITLALGVRAMAQKKAIIRYLPAVETLGAVTLVATDKTGTLTRGEMSIEKIFIPDSQYNIEGDGYTPIGNIELNGEKIKQDEHKALAKLLTAGVLCNDSNLIKEKDEWKIIGDPTEGSITVAAAKMNIIKSEIEEIYPRIDEIPFHTTKRFMATLHKYPGDGDIVAIKGAAEKIITLCSSYYCNNRKISLPAKNKKTIMGKARELSSQGYRVLMLAEKNIETSEKVSEKDLIGATLLGICAMKDSPRREVPLAIQQAHRAGIRVAMVTGDHALTAQSVASNIDISNEPIVDSSNSVITGDILEKMSVAELNKVTKYCNVYSRISPLQKLQLVKQFQKQGHIVAVTGDGINDSAALKQADIGIAMGKTGTDVSREAASMVLANDNFATIIAAISEGRAIYNNIKRVLLYLLSTNIGEIFVIMLPLIIGISLPGKPGEYVLPVLPLQILWINLITDGFAVIPLALEPKHDNIMKSPPRKPNTPILDNVIRWRILLVSLTMALGTTYLFNRELHNSGYEQARTVAFVTMILFQLINMFNCRSLTRSVIDTKIFHNAYVAISFFAAFILTIFAVYSPFFQKIFYTTALSLTQWISIILVSLTVILVVEIEKYFRNRKEKYKI